MQNRKDLIAVEARTDSYYSITESDTGIKRVWEKGNTLHLSEDTLRDFASSVGGRKMLENNLIVHDKELLEDLLGHEVELEYTFTKKDVLDLLKDGTDEQLTDALNFAPTGVKDLIRLCAIETRLPDMNKRAIISNILKIDLNKAIEIDIENLKEDEEYSGEKDSAPTGRLSQQPFKLEIPKTEGLNVPPSTK